MSMRPVAAVSAALLLAACNNFSEYSSAPQAGLIFLDPITLAVEGTLDGVEGGTSICATGPTTFCVASNTGRMFLYDADTMTPDTSFVIGLEQSAGYGDMLYVPWKSSIYIIGAMGSILEIGIPGGEEKAELTFASNPSHLSMNQTATFLYVTDPSNRSVYRMSISSNVLYKTFVLERTPVGTACCTRGLDTLLIATSDPAGVGYVQPVESVFRREVAYRPTVDIEATTPFHGLICGLHANPSGSGTLSLVDSLQPFSIARNVVFPGTPRVLYNHTDEQRLYIISVEEVGTFRVMCYNKDFEQFENSVELPGYPVDMTSAGNRLVILTY